MFWILLTRLLMYLIMQLPIGSICCCCLSLVNVYYPIFLTCGFLLSRDVNKFCPVEKITLRLQFIVLLNTNSVQFSSVQFSSVTQSCTTLCDPMDHSTPGLPVHHQPPEFTHTHLHWVSDAIQPSHPLSSPSPLALNLSQHQGLFK